MKDTELAYKMRTLFDKKITIFYFASFKGVFGKVQIDLLSYLYENDNVTAKQLTEYLNVPKQHVSKILKRLQMDHLVETSVDPSDKREKRLCLSKSGRELVGRHIQASDEHFLLATKTLSQQDRDRLNEAMHTIIDIMGKLK